MKAKELPRRLQEERARAMAEAAAKWHAERIGTMSRSQRAALHAERIAELELELRAGPWGHALRNATAGDASKLAQALTRGRVPPELADLVYSVILAAPWAKKKRGTQRQLNAVDKINVQALYAMARGADRPRDVALDELAHRYGVSRSTIERAVAGIAAPSVTKRASVKAQGQR